MLHVHGGMLAWIIVAACMRDAGSLLALIAACFVEIANEILDRLRTGAWRWDETIPDLGHSLVWPVLLFGLARAGML